MRTIEQSDNNDYNELCVRYKSAFPDSDPPPEFWYLTDGFVPTQYDPFFDGVETAIKTGVPVEDWDSLTVDYTMEPGAVA